MLLLTILLGDIVLSMLNEGIHEWLAEVYDEFDRHCRVTNTDYSIDADYPNFQGYTILSCPDFDGFLRHISNFIKDRPINMTVNGTPLVYDDLNNREFRLPKRRNNLITFALTPLQERNKMKILGEAEIQTTIQGSNITISGELSPDDLRKLADGMEQGQVDTMMFNASYVNPKAGGVEAIEGTVEASEVEPVGEDQYKFPCRGRMARKQNPARIPRFGPPATSAYAAESFADRFERIMIEEIGFVDPDILFTKSIRPEIMSDDDDIDDIIDEHKKRLESMLGEYLNKLENVADEHKSYIIEELINQCTNNINRTNKIKEVLNDSA